ncbi:hypothetical protein [Nitratireductor indicus]|nr:hypothetical protein [Nitratireductor indicus]SFQ70163.1 hypothetical protein SAMN05216176_110112 [Nitratireductor indicus]
MPPALALIDVLPDFSAPAPSLPELPEDDTFSTLATPLPHAPTAPPEVQTRPLEQRQEVNEAAIVERLTRDHETAVAEIEARHAEELAAARRSLAEDAARLVQQRFDELEQQVIGLTAETTARILGVVLTEDLQKKSIAELERIIREALDDRESVRIRLIGAPLLWEALKTGLGTKADHVDFSEGPGFDISLSIDEKLFETRLTEWSDALNGLIA